MSLADELEMMGPFVHQRGFDVRGGGRDPENHAALRWYVPRSVIEMALPGECHRSDAIGAIREAADEDLKGVTRHLSQIVRRVITEEKCGRTGPTRDDQQSSQQDRGQPSSQ